MQNNLKTKTLSGLIWQFAQKILAQVLSFVITVILTRLLTPEDYGVVALACMFNVLVGIFVSGSMDAALIQKKDADELDYNTVFYSSLFMSIIIYGVIYFGSPYFAAMYHNQQICSIMRVLALTMPIGAFTMVQSAIVTRRMQFKKFFFVGIIGQIVSASIGISMAYSGYGPWALVAQQMVSGITNSCVLIYLVRWWPKLMFSWARFRELFAFAWKKTAAGFIGTLCDQLKGYLIGFKYTAADLAYFNRGEGIPSMFNTNIAGTINTVLFPALSQLQGDYSAVKRGMRRAMMTSSYVLMPIFLGLAAISDKVVLILYTEKWAPAIPFMQIACLTGGVIVLNSANLQSIFAIGKSGEVLKLEFYKKPVMILLLFVGIYFGPIGISIAMLFYSLYVLYMNTRPNKKYLKYSLTEQINDVKAGIILSSVMAVLVYLAGLYIENDKLSVTIQIIFGVIIYVGFSELFKPEAYSYVRDMALKLLYNKGKYSYDEHQQEDKKHN